MDILTIAQPMVGVEFSQVLGRQIESCDNCPSTERIGIGKKTFVADLAPFTIFGRPCRASRFLFRNTASPTPSRRTPACTRRSKSARSIFSESSTVTSRKSFKPNLFATRFKVWAASMDLPKRVPPTIASIGRRKRGCPSWQASHKLLAEALLQQNVLQRYSAMVDFELESSNLASSSPASTGPNVFIGNIADSSTLDSACTASRIAWS